MILSEKDIRQTDILHGKGSKCARHIGTMAFKALVRANLSTYMDEATESCDKTYMTVEIVENILALGGRFLRETKIGSSSGQSWVEMDKMKAREKVRSAFGNAAKSKRKQRPPTGATQEYSSSQEFDTESSFIHIVNKLKKQDALAPKLPTKTPRTTSLKVSSSKRRSSELQLTKKSAEPLTLVLHQNSIKAATKFPQLWTAPDGADYMMLRPLSHFAPPPDFDRCRPMLIPVPPPSSSIALLPRPTLIPSVAMIGSAPTKVSPQLVQEHREGQYLNAADIRPADILIGKSKQCNYHLGTIAFKVLISLDLAAYMNPEATSCEKTFMNMQVVDGIYSEGGRFLKESKHGSGVWLEINKNVAREKVRQGFRDAGSAQKKERPGALLSKIKFSSNFDTGNSFSDILNVVSRDPAVLQSLSSAISVKASPRAPKNNVVRMLKIAPKRSHPVV